MQSQRLLRVVSPHFVAGAVWERQEGEWVCVHAAYILYWMRRKSAGEVSRYLKRKGWEYAWI